MNRPQTIAQIARHCPSPPLGNLGNVDFLRLLEGRTSIAQIAQQLFEKRSGQWSKRALKSTLPNCPDCPPSTRGCRCRAIGPASLGGDRRPGRAWRCLTSVAKYNWTRSDDRQCARRPRAENHKVNARKAFGRRVRFLTVWSTRARVTASRYANADHYARIRDCSHAATLADSRQCVWRDAYEEKAAIREHRGGLQRVEAEAAALLDLASMWRGENPLPASDCAACCHCRKPAPCTPVLAAIGHAWLHEQCWAPVNSTREKLAREAIIQALGIANAVARETTDAARGGGDASST